MAMQGIEPLLQQLRIWKVQSYIPANSTVVDFGCDEELTMLKQWESRIARGIGIDIVSTPEKRGKLEILPGDLEKKVPLESDFADAVTMLAVLEHLKKPERAVAEAFRILKPGGVFLVTVPSARIEKLLPMLGKFHIVREDMIDQHENYFTPDRLQQMAQDAGFSYTQAEFWELGCNVFLRAVK